MKKIFFIILLALSADAYECELKDDRGGIYKTISSTYKNNGESRSMWFEFSRYSKKVLVESGKSKKEAFKDKMLKDVQGIVYGKDKKVKSEWDGRYFESKEVIPGTVGEWMWNILNVWAFVDQNNLTKEQLKMICDYAIAGISHHGYGIGEEKIDPSKFKDDDTQPTMTIEETKKWLEENDPRIKK